jgi:hypothetical protein
MLSVDDHRRSVAPHGAPTKATKTPPCARSACFALDLHSPAVAPRSGGGHRGKANCLRPGMAELFAGRWTTSTAGNRTNDVRPARMPGSSFLWLLSFDETKESDSLAAGECKPLLRERLARRRQVQTSLESESQDYSKVLRSAARYTDSGFGLSPSSFHSRIARATSSGFILPSAASAAIAACAIQ